ncbi:hypothetical protein P4S72_24995 [Vibrio sp. PP-XX7]
MFSHPELEAVSLTKKKNVRPANAAHEHPPRHERSAVAANTAANTTNAADDTIMRHAV